jgi:hypothetical protein
VYPSADPNYASVLERLENKIEGMRVLAQQQQGGYPSKDPSVVRRKELRRNLQHGFLRHQVTIAEVVSTQTPGLAERFRLPPTSATHEGFRAFARKLLEQGQAHRDVLASMGWRTGCSTI